MKQEKEEFMIKFFESLKIDDFQDELEEFKTTFKKDKKTLLPEQLPSVTVIKNTLRIVKEPSTSRKYFSIFNTTQPSTNKEQELCHTDKILHPYQGMTVKYKDIDVFENTSSKSSNDKNNKLRENIISCIINEEIPSIYYKYSFRWRNLQQEIIKYIKSLEEDCPQKPGFYSCNCIQKAGRKYNYDFLINLNSVKFNIEFKFNARNVDGTPQFVSPMKPSQYLSNNYEEYYYDNYLYLLSYKFKLPLPNKEQYMNTIHSTAPKCMIEYQKKYYNGCKSSSKYTGILEDIEFYEYSKKISKQSIEVFIENNELKIDTLSRYLKNTQKNKFYMLYKESKIYSEKINMEKYEIISFEKNPKLQKYTATTKTGAKIRVLLRWKNGNGIAYPAFQIS